MFLLPFLFIPPTWLAVHLWRCTRISRAVRGIGILLLYIIGLAYPLDYLLLGSISGPDMPKPLYLFQTGLLVTELFFFLLTVIADCIRFFHACLFRPLQKIVHSRHSAADQQTRNTAPTDPERRRFLAGGLASAGVISGAALFSAGTTACGMVNGTALPDIAKTQADLKNLPQGLEGFTIALLTDIHIGTLTSIDWVQSVVQSVNALHPDLICIAGDITDGFPGDSVPGGKTREEAVHLLAGLTSPYGTWGCMGNHDFLNCPKRWGEIYTASKIQMLRDTGVSIPVGDTHLILCGRDDKHALRLGITPAPAAQIAHPFLDIPGLRVVLDHRPSRADENAAAGFALQLSGHTHGGQCLGMNRIVASANAGMVSGWYTRGAMQTYVSRGTGLWPGFPVRLGVPAEITLLTLRSADTSSPTVNRG